MRGKPVAIIGAVLVAGATIPASMIYSQEAVDTATLRPDELGFSFVESRVDSTNGFVIGGTNKTAGLRDLETLNGQSIQALEARMRPDAASSSGFLGKDEHLLDVLTMDNALVVDKNGLSHQDLARPLLLIGYYAKKHAIGKEVVVRHGKVDLSVRIRQSRGFQDSPFRDGTKTNIDVTIKRMSDGKVLEYSLLVPHMIERYGFYEGKGTSYRVDPKAIIDLLELKKAT